MSLRSYADAVNCSDDSGRSDLLERHAEALRAHCRGLGGKRYHDIHRINSPDFVLMCIPVETAFFAAISFEQNVVLLTNSTLRTVANVWRQQKHALEIADRGGKLYDKFVGFVQDLEEAEGAEQRAGRGVGRSVEQA